MFVMFSQIWGTSVPCLAYNQGRTSHPNWRDRASSKDPSKSAKSASCSFPIDMITSMNAFVPSNSLNASNSEVGSNYGVRVEDIMYMTAVLWACKSIRMSSAYLSASFPLTHSSEIPPKTIMPAATTASVLALRICDFIYGHHAHHPMNGFVARLPRNSGNEDSMSGQKRSIRVSANTPISRIKLPISPQNLASCNFSSSGFTLQEYRHREDVLLIIRLILLALIAGMLLLKLLVR